MRATGVLLGVELGDVSVSQQSNLQKLLGGYSLFDGTLGMVSLLVVLFLVNGWFGVHLTDQEASVILIVLTIVVVALLHEEVSTDMHCSSWRSGINFVRRLCRLYHLFGTIRAVLKTISTPHYEPVDAKPCCLRQRGHGSSRG